MKEVSRHRVFFCSQRLNLSNHPVQFYPYQMFTTTTRTGGGKEAKDGNREKKHPLNSEHAVLLSNHIHNRVGVICSDNTRLLILLN